MKVAIATESFPPHFDGVAKSVLHTAEELHCAGHDVHVIAPAPPRRHDSSDYPWPVTYVPSLPVPRYRAFRAGLPNARLRQCLANNVDVLHLASPIGYTATAAAIAGQRHIPTVAIWQTDLPAWTAAYHMSAASRLLWRRLRRVHNLAALTLAPTSHAQKRLEFHGIDNVHLWPRGVNLTQFHPRHYSRVLKESLCPNGELLVGYIGRLAREKTFTYSKASANCPASQSSSPETDPNEPDSKKPSPKHTSSANSPALTSAPYMPPSTCSPTPAVKKPSGKPCKKPTPQPPPSSPSTPEEPPTSCETASTECSSTTTTPPRSLTPSKQCSTKANNEPTGETKAATKSNTVAGNHSPTT